VTTRVNGARKKIDEGKYGPTEITSDALGLWICAVEGLWSAALRPAGAAVPLAFFKLQVNDEIAGPITIPVKLTDGDEPPAKTDLTSADGARTISASNLVLKFETVGVGKVVDRTKLSVKLFDLNNPPAGVYEGYAYIKQTPLAHIVAVVVP